MKGFFGLTRSKDFSDALDKTFAKFESMPAQDMFALGSKHSSGDIAMFMAVGDEATSDHALELRFVLEPAVSDHRLKGFTAFFSQKSTMCFEVEGRVNELQTCTGDSVSYASAAVVPLGLIAQSCLAA